MCMPLALEALFLAHSWKIAFWLAESQYAMSCLFTSDLLVAW